MESARMMPSDPLTLPLLSLACPYIVEYLHPRDGWLVEKRLATPEEVVRYVADTPTPYRRRYRVV